jgi:hypothetical protein
LHTCIVSPAASSYYICALPTDPRITAFEPSRAQTKDVRCMVEVTEVSNLSYTMAPTSIVAA